VGSNLTETIGDVCLEFSDFVGNLAAAMEVISDIKTWLGGAEKEVRGKEQHGQKKGVDWTLSPL
jgi:hypothetical protein